MVGKHARDTCACGREKLAQASFCWTCFSQTPTRDAAERNALALGYESLAAFWAAHEGLTHMEAAAALRVASKWVKVNRPARVKRPFRPATVARPPRPASPQPPKRREKPRDLCACGGPKLVRSRRCQDCANRARVEPAALAEALRRDARPDGDKLPARLTLLKALWRQTQRRSA
jgi:hypothetical protein